jgi:hypothetical protein
MTRTHRQNKRLDNRAAFMSLELALTLPVLMIVLLAMFEFSMLFFARGEVVEASRIGARTASLPGSTWDNVENAVYSVLGPRLRQRVSINAELGDRTGDLVNVAVMVPMQDASPDLLWPIGYGLGGRNLVSETRMVRE